MTISCVSRFQSGTAKKKNSLSQAVELRCILGRAWALAHLGERYEAEYLSALRRMEQQGRDDESNACVNSALISPFERDAVREAYLYGVHQVRDRLRDLGVRPFDEEKWTKACELMSKEAAVGCGQSDVVWSRQLTSKIDALLVLLQCSDSERTKAITIATNQGWMSPEQEEELDEMCEKLNLCSHGLDIDTCPAGCFEF